MHGVPELNPISTWDVEEWEERQVQPNPKKTTLTWVFSFESKANGHTWEWDRTNTQADEDWGLNLKYYEILSLIP